MTAAACGRIQNVEVIGEKKRAGLQIPDTIIKKKAEIMRYIQMNEDGHL